MALFNISSRPTPDQLDRVQKGIDAATVRGDTERLHTIGETLISMIEAQSDERTATALSDLSVLALENAESLRPDDIEPTP